MRAMEIDRRGGGGGGGAAAVRGDGEKVKVSLYGFEALSDIIPREA